MKLMISSPKKARREYLKMRSEMEDFLQKKQEHELRKSQPKELSLVDHMNSRGMMSNWVARRSLAEHYGIKDYAGTSDQHARMLAILHGEPTSNTTE